MFSFPEWKEIEVGAEATSIIFIKVTLTTC